MEFESESSYYTVLEKNGKITLPNDVIEKLGLEEGEQVAIDICHIKSRKENYGFLRSKAKEIANELLRK